MKYLLMYKFSQDHLELFFGAVRQAGGFNNNPTVKQFTASYKRLLMRSHIKGGKGNVQEDPTKILHVVSDVVVDSEEDLTMTTIYLRRKYKLDDSKPLQIEHDYHDAPDFLQPQSEFKEAAVSYIAGFVVKKLKVKMTCFHCCNGLTTIEQPSFIKHKNRGGLTVPSKSVVKVCCATERRFQRMLNKTKGKLPKAKGGILPAIVNSVLNDLDYSTLFPELDIHFREDSTLNENHLYTTVRLIATHYCKIKLHELAVEENQKIQKKKIRKKLSKQILFAGQ